MDFLEVALFVGDELRGRGEVDARIGAVFGGGFFLAVVDLVGLRPFRPRIVLGAGGGGLRHDLELDDGLAAVAERSAYAVGAGVAAADDHDVLAFGGDGRVGRLAVQEVLRVGVEELHRQVDALGVTAGEREVAALGGADGEDDRVEVLAELFGRDVDADVDAALEGHAFGLEEGDAAQHDFLLVELHVRDAVHEQASGTVGAFEDGDVMSGVVQLRGGGEAGGAGTDDGDLLAGALRRGAGDDPAVLVALVDDRDFDVLDRDGRLVHPEHAGALARGGADAAGELREVIGLVEAFQCFAPEAAVDEVVPLGDQVVDRAAAGHPADELARVAERHAAVHAAGALFLELLVGVMVVDLLPVADAGEGIAVRREFALVFDKSGRFSHGAEGVWCGRDG